MSNAKQCDRCKRLYDPFHSTDMLDHPDEMVQFRNPVFKFPKDFVDGTFDSYLVPGSADTRIDLCPKCTVDFRAFMRNETPRM